MERGAYQGEPFIIEQNIRVYKIIQNLLLAHQGPLYNILALFGCLFFFPYTVVSRASAHGRSYLSRDFRTSGRLRGVLGAYRVYK